MDVPYSHHLILQSILIFILMKLNFFTCFQYLIFLMSSSLPHPPSSLSFFLIMWTTLTFTIPVNRVFLSCLVVSQWPLFPVCIHMLFFFFLKCRPHHYCIFHPWSYHGRYISHHSLCIKFKLALMLVNYIQVCMCTSSDPIIVLFWWWIIVY